MVGLIEATTICFSTYTISISVATYVASNIIDGNKNVLNKYIEFLKTGSDKTPIEAFNILGVNLENKNVYETAIKYFDSLIEEFKKVNEN